jgi:hypothetical protein
MDTDYGALGAEKRIPRIYGTRVSFTASTHVGHCHSLPVAECIITAVPKGSLVTGEYGHVLRSCNRPHGCGDSWSDSEPYRAGYPRDNDEGYEQ